MRRLLARGIEAVAYAIYQFGVLLFKLSDRVCGPSDETDLTDAEVVEMWNNSTAANTTVSWTASRYPPAREGR